MKTFLFFLSFLLVVDFATVYPSLPSFHIQFSSLYCAVIMTFFFYSFIILSLPIFVSYFFAKKKKTKANICLVVAWTKTKRNEMTQLHLQSKFSNFQNYRRRREIWSTIHSIWAILVSRVICGASLNSTSTSSRHLNAGVNYISLNRCGEILSECARALVCVSVCFAFK